MTLPDRLSIDQLAEELGCRPDEALDLVRTTGARGIIRTNDRRFLIPTGLVEQLRTERARRAADAPDGPDA